MKCFFGVHAWKPKFVSELMAFAVVERGALPSALHLFQCVECERCQKREVRVIFQAPPNIMLAKAALWKMNELDKSDEMPPDTQIFIYKEQKFESLAEYARRLDQPNKPTLTLVK